MIINPTKHLSKKPTQGRFRYLLIKDHVYTVDERPSVVFASSHPFIYGADSYARIFIAFYYQDSMFLRESQLYKP
jgi:hypothetical protein